MRRPHVTAGGKELEQAEFSAMASTVELATGSIILTVDERVVYLDT